jgi:Ca2+-binding EF-hand superfamily protein
MTRSANHRPLTATTLALMIVLAGATLAHARMRGDFDAADANHDGRVTLQEYQSYATSRLMDANGRIAKRFKRLPPEEQAERLQQRFEKADHGHKGYLDRKDWND